ncbi:hypothetical protein PHABIO_83 [Pseudomonas phage Phabio]|uniref:Uncharacterized protein n=1 Tax=Pseudomonas phage Phabio TaxID=2006668 RepID=A0A1Y0SVX1_9CAUD|nr:hypothetical protein MZD05_gp083 [Pseudomonas phage Phabio]ARV76714.1 hypothetical protein PHABIO_83 [Pseudomonas phage Phabio]
MSEIQPVLKEFLKTVGASIDETIATSTVQGVADYERGVKDGALGLADQLQSAEYTITDKEGAIVKTEPEGEVTPVFSSVFLSDVWKDPSN